MARLIQTGKLHLELQRSPALAMCQWHEQSGLDLVALGAFDLPLDQINAR